MIGRTARAAVVISLGLAACDSTPFQVIEELEFAASLGIDLTAMERLPTGVYIEDLVVGTGNPVTSTSEVDVAYEGYLANGSRFGEGQFNFVMGTGSVITGFEIGVLGMNQGGRRRIIIPPELGYGDENQGGIPAGSVLVFVVDAIDVGGVGG